MDTPTIETRPTKHLESARARDHGPVRTPTRWLKEFFASRMFNSALLFGVVPVGTAFGHWISKIIALPQLGRLVSALSSVMATKSTSEPPASGDS